MTTKRKSAIAACRNFGRLALALAVVSLASCSSPESDKDESRADTEVRFAIHHVGMGVDSIEESLVWYKEKLGFEFEREFRLEYMKSTVVFIRRDNFRLELFAFDDGRDVPEYRSDPAEDLRHGGISHVAFQVGDVRAFAATLEAQGVHFTIPVTEFVAGNPVAFISDPSGNNIELYQSPSSE